MTSFLPATLERLFKNALRYDQPHFPFSDAFSQFSVGFRADRALGLGFLHPRSVLSTYQVTEPALELWIGEKGHWSPMMRQNLDSWPWLAQEEGVLACGDGFLNVRARHVFEDERTLVSQFELTLESEATLELEIAFSGIVQGDRKRYMTPYFDGPPVVARETFLQVEGNAGAIVCGLRNPTQEAGLPWVALRMACINQSMTSWIGTNPFWSCELTDELPQSMTGQERNFAYALRTPQAVTFLPGQTIVFECRTQLLVGAATMPATLSWPQIQNSNVTDMVEMAKQRFFQNLNPSTLPETGSAALDFQVARARLGLLRDGLRGLDGEFGEHIASLCTADTSDFSCSFFWDSLFSSVAIGAFNNEYSRGAIATTFVRESDFDGSSPERKWNYSVPGRMFQQAPQSPVASWAVTEFLTRQPDENFLAFIYPKLKRNHLFWEKHSDFDGDGLSEYRWSGQAADNSPLWDPYVSSLDKTTGCGWLPPVASVPLNCFIYKDAVHLEQLARAAGQSADADYFARRQQQLHERIMATCYVPEENRFWDFNQLTRTHRRVKTFYMFWPLYARLPMPKESARDLIENVLLDPAQFFGAVPFPSVAYDEPTYEPSGYWRGRAWPHISYWLLETLVAYGYIDEANEAAHRILAWFAANGIRENISTDATEAHPRGFLDYNWGCAAFELIAARHYLKAKPVYAD